MFASATMRLSYGYEVYIKTRAKKCSSQLELLNTVILSVLQLLVKEFRHQEDRRSEMNRTFELSFQYISCTVYMSEI